MGGAFTGRSAAKPGDAKSTSAALAKSTFFTTGTLRKTNMNMNLMEV
jgi:hypothetical protein